MATQTGRQVTRTTSTVQRGALSSKKRQDMIIRVGATIICLLGLVVILFPLAWMISTSLKTRAEVAKFPPVWIPSIPQWDNYRVALTGANPFGRYFMNTMFYAISVMVAEAVSCSFIAYGFARLRAPGKNAIFVLVLATMMLPTWVTLIPQYIMFSKIGWLDSYKPLIVPHWFGSAYLIFLLRQFYRGLPKDYEEAALIDGANYLRIWARIIVPLSLPALGAVTIMSFMFHYQDFAGPLIYINSQINYPLALGLQQFQAPFGGTRFDLLMAASVVTIIPPIIVFFIAQRYFIQGIVVSGVKG
ncbi:MAG: carbohydrate ABC transporter permease [Roseiflexaceae bacterium]